MLLTWGFTPKVLGYIPNVRGVITGLAESDAWTAAATSMREGTADRGLDAPGPRNAG